MATIGPTDGDDIDGMMEVDGGLVDVEDEATIFPTETNLIVATAASSFLATQVATTIGPSIPVETEPPAPTFPPEEEAIISTHTCGIGSPANESICNEYKLP